MTRDKVIWEGWFSLLVPAEWDFYEEDGVITVYREDDGVGALQISLLTRDREELPDMDEARHLALSFAAQQGWEISDGTIQTECASSGIASTFTYNETDESRFWEVWHIISRHRAALITYTSDIAQSDAEKDDRRDIISSFRWE